MGEGEQVSTPVLDAFKCGPFVAVLASHGIVSFVVTGVDVYGKRFKRSYDLSAVGYAFGINLWRGSVWGVRENGTRKLLKRVRN